MRTVLRVDLVSHGLTDALRTARFPDDEPVTAAGRRKVTAAGLLPGARVRTGPERRAVDTAVLLGLHGDPDERLRDLDVGVWRGAQLAAIPADECHAWLTDPAFRGHGGEAIADLVERVRQWLADIAAVGEPTVAVTHPAVLRAAVLVALDAPTTSLWRIDVAPVGTVRLHHRNGWTLRL